MVWILARILLLSLASLDMLVSSFGVCAAFVSDLTEGACPFGWVLPGWFWVACIYAPWNAGRLPWATRYSDIVPRYGHIHNSD